MLSVSEWSDRHRVLSSKASAEPGRWRTARTPYLKAIMDCPTPMSPIERVVFMKGAQVGAPLALDTRVLGVSEIFTGRECFELEFEDGERIVADAQRRWPVWEYTHSGLKSRLATTAELAGREHFSNGKPGAMPSPCARRSSCRRGIC